MRALSLECSESSIDQRRAGKKYGEPGCLVFGGVVISTGVHAELLSSETRKWRTQGPNEDFCLPYSEFVDHPDMGAESSFWGVRYAHSAGDV